MPKGKGFEIYPGDELNPQQFIYCCVPVPDTKTHRLAFASQINDLARWHLWQRDEIESGAAIAKSWNYTVKRVYEQLDERLESCGDTDTPDCIAYPMTAPFIDWFPVSPYESDTVDKPTGYLNYPWQIGGLTLAPIIDEIIDFLGVEQSILEIPEAAVMTFLPNILPDFRTVGGGILNSGFPRMKINFRGTGLIRLHFVSIPLFGGMVSVARDFEIAPQDILGEYVDFLDFTDTIGRDIDIIDLNRDFSYPPETNVVSAEEFYFDTPGDHFLELTFLPVVDDSAQFLRFGGGIHFIELCSGLQPPENLGDLIVTDLSSLEQAVYNGNTRILRDLCGCVGGGSSGGSGGDSGGYTDANDDGIDDKTGAAIPKAREIAYGELVEKVRGLVNLRNDVESFATATYDGTDIDRTAVAEYLETIYGYAAPDALEISNAMKAASFHTAPFPVSNTVTAVWCGDLGLRGEIIKSVYDTVATPEPRRATGLLIKLAPPDLIEQFASDAVPNSFYLTEPCYLNEPEKLTITEIGQIVVGYENTIQWDNYKSFRRVRITGTGFLEDENQNRLYPFYSYENSTDTYTYNKPGIGVKLGVLEQQFGTPQPSLNQIAVTGTIPSDASPLENGKYFVREFRTLPGTTITGKLEYVIEDLGSE